MALSEHESQLLAEMEAAFAQEDPRLVSTLTGNARTRQGSRVLIGIVGLLLGMAILFGGLVSKLIAVGLFGFVVALTGAFLIITNVRFGRGGKQGVPKNKKAKWSDRLEHRWDRRNNES